MRRAAGLRLLLLLPLIVPSAARAQVSLTTLGTAYTQNFDTLATGGTGSTWSDNSTITGWYAQFGTGTNPTVYIPGTGSSTTGALYSFGAAAATDRALGSVGSGGTTAVHYAVALQNNTGSTIASLDVSYIGEQWRAGGGTMLAQKVDVQYQVVAAGGVTDANAPTTGWVDADALDFTSPVFAVAAAALNGNVAPNRTSLSTTLNVTVNTGQLIWLRWLDIDHPSNDHGLAVDDLSVTPQAGLPNLTVTDVTMNEGDSLTTTFSFKVQLSEPAPAGGVTFEIRTNDGIAQDGGVLEDNDYVANGPLTGQSIGEGFSEYTFSVMVNGGTSCELDETFFVDVSTVVGANVADDQGLGTITNDDLCFIHDVQGNGSASPFDGSTSIVQGIVTADFQESGQLSGFFLQEEAGDVDADPMTSEGIFVYCGGCSTAVAVGYQVRVTGEAKEFFTMTEIDATGLGASVSEISTGNTLPSAASIDLPVVGPINDFYEPFEGMLVQFTDTLTVGEYFELGRFGSIELFEGDRPLQFTQTSAPEVAGYAAHLEDLDRRRVILDDDDNISNGPLTLDDGEQFVFHPQANGGLSVGTQGADFFRGGDTVSDLTGVLHWDFAGSGSVNAWRIRPTSADPVDFTVANPRPATPPDVGGDIKAASMNLLNYFTTIDTTSSSNSGPCGPSGTLDCRGADGLDELDRQRARAALVICALDADVVAFMELENTTPSDTITDLLGAVNALCGGVDPYFFVDTGDTLGTDAIRVALIYRSATLEPVGAALTDNALDEDNVPIHNRPPTAQVFDVIDPANPSLGERFAVVASHFKSKGCDDEAEGTPDDDQLDGAGCYNSKRSDQAARLLAWINSDVLDALRVDDEEESDVLLLGDFNSYTQEPPIVIITEAAYTDLEAEFHGPSAYSYLFDGQLGHLDYALASQTLTPKVAGVGAWHINADEIPLFDYNDEDDDGNGEAPFEEKPDGSDLDPERNLFESGVAARASDHDPVLVGLFFQSADLSITKVEGAEPITAGLDLAYTITVTNDGPNSASTVAWSDTLPTDTTFVSVSEPGGWTCLDPGVGNGGVVSCSIATLAAAGSAEFTLTVHVAPSVASGAQIENTASVTSTTVDPDDDDTDLSATETTAVVTAADLSITKTDAIDPILPGTQQTYTVTVANDGPSDAANVTWSDTLPTGTSFVSVDEPLGWTCDTGSPPAISCSILSLPASSSVPFSLVATFDAGLAAAAVITNTASVSSATTEATPGDETGEAETTVSFDGAFFTVTPCRAIDTRSGAPLQDGVPQTFALHGTCGIPATAKVVVINVTAVAPTGAGALALWAGDATPSPFDTMPFAAGRTRALLVAALVSDDAAGEVKAQAAVAGGGTVHLVVDVMGYFE